MFGENSKPDIKPLSPVQSMAAAHVAKGFKLQLVASEPLVRDPVSFDWAAVAYVNNVEVSLLSFEIFATSLKLVISKFLHINYCF